MTHKILKSEVLVRLTKTWRTCREQYPGWVIAPADAREAIWTHTEYWLDYLLEQWPRMPVGNALLLLRETIWRMETALNPLYLNHVEVATAVLAKINPRPALLPWPANGEEAPPDSADTQELLESWVEVAFSLMREARDDLDSRRFDEWQYRLKQVAEQRPQWLARWHFERAFLALLRFDFAGLEAALLAWPIQLEELPFWETRRAALWAELGETARAESLAEASLQAIRVRLPTDRTDYRLLSQEGWAIRLLMALKQRGMERMPESERARFQERTAELARYECNPWDITEYLELALKAPLPSLMPVSIETREFDPGTTSQHYKFSRHGPMEMARPAFALLRVSEEAAIPMRVGQLTVLNSEAKQQVSLCIAPFAFSWALATAVRTEQEETIERLLDRAIVGALPQDQVENLVSWLLEVAENALSKLDPARRGISDRPLWERILPLALEALSRLLLRAESNQAMRAVVLAEKICQVKAPQHLFGAIKHVDAVFRRTIRWCLSKEDVLQHIHDWLVLPLPSKIGGPEHLQRFRPEPFQYIKCGAGAQWKRPGSLEVTQRIQQLLDAVANGPIPDRQFASLRLVVVALLGGLLPGETRRLKAALWSKQSSVTHFPINVHILPIASLRLCPMPEADRTSLIRRTFLEEPMPQVIQVATDGRGVSWDKQRAVEYFTTLSGVTRTLWTAREVRHLTYNWTEEEALVLVSRIMEWWRIEKAHISSPPHPFGNPLEPCISIIVDLFATTLLMRLAKLPLERSHSVLELLDSLEAAGFNVLPARPACIAIGADKAHVTRVMLNALLGTSLEDVRATVVAVRNWAFWSKERGLPTLPSELLHAAVWKIANRAGPGLTTLLGMLAYLIEKRVVRLSSNEVELLLDALGFLLTETELATDVQTAMLASEPYSRFSYTERPEHRRQAARLAKSLERYFNRRKGTVPAVIMRWRESCLRSPLPELRQVWKAEDDDD